MFRRGLHLAGRRSSSTLLPSRTTSLGFQPTQTQAQPSVYVPHTDDAYKVLCNLERRGTIESALMEELFSDPDEELESSIDKYLPKHLWNPDLWTWSGSRTPYYFVQGWSHPEGEPTDLAPKYSVNDMFDGKDEIFLFQNPVDPDICKEFFTPSQFALGMIDEAEKEVCIAVYSMHENRNWSVFTDLVESKLASAPNLSFRIICHPNKYSDSVIDRFDRILKKRQNAKRVQIRYCVGIKAPRASSNGNSHAKIWIADSKIGMNSSLNISEPAFTLNTENGTGYRNEERVSQLQRAFDSMWKVSETYFAKVI